VKLVLGTAAFGLDYGITNKRGKIGPGESRQLIAAAYSNGIRCYDTAQGYGDAEKTVGLALSEIVGAQVTTKIALDTKGNKAKKANPLREKVEISLGRLGLSRLDTVLLHSFEDLINCEREELKMWVEEIKQLGLVERFGVSVYTPEEALRCLGDMVDVVQLPLSIYNQDAAVKGSIYHLNRENIEVQVRSVYLQGLAVADICQWPKWIEKEERKKHSMLMEEARKRQLSLPRLCLDFVKATEGVDKVVVGVCSQGELVDLLDGWREENCWGGEDLRIWDFGDSLVKDPRKWPSR